MNVRIRQNHFLAIVFIAIAVLTFIHAKDLPELESNLNIIGASFLPKLLAFCLGGMSVFILLDHTNEKYLEFKISQETRMVLGFMALLFLYIYTISIIGFEISSFVFLMLTMLMLGLRKIPVMLGIATILPAIVYVVFVKMMYIPIPSLIQGL